MRCKIIFEISAIKCNKAGVLYLEEHKHSKKIKKVENSFMWLDMKCETCGASSEIKKKKKEEVCESWTNEWNK